MVWYFILVPIPMFHGKNSQEISLQMDLIGSNAENCPQDPFSRLSEYIYITIIFTITI